MILSFLEGAKLATTLRSLRLRERNGEAILMIFTSL